MQLFLQIVLVILVILFAVALVFNMMRETRRLSAQFTLQLKMAEAQTSMANPLKFDEIKKIVQDIIINQCIMEIDNDILHDIIINQCIMEIANNGYAKKTDEEMSLIINDIILNISTLTEQSLSPELIRQWEKFSTEEYRTRFIIFTVRTAFISQLGTVSRNQREADRLQRAGRSVPHQNQNDTKKR